MKRFSSIILAFLIFFSTISEPVLAISQNIVPVFGERFEESPYEGELQAYKTEASNVQLMGSGPSPILHQSLTVDDGLRASIVGLNKGTEVVNKKTNKSDTYTLNLPVMRLQGDNTYSLKIAQAAIIESIDSKDISNGESIIRRINDIDTGNTVGEMIVEKNGKDIIVRYAFKSSTSGNVYTISSVNLKLKTRETSDSSYVLLAGDDETTIDFYGFDLKGPVYSPDKKSASFTIGEKAGYKLVEARDIVVNKPATIDLASNNYEHKFSLASGKNYAEVRVIFSDGLSSIVKNFELGQKEQEEIKYIASASSSFKIDGDNIVATVSLTKDPRSGAPGLPEKITITRFDIGNGLGAGVDEATERFGIKHEKFEIDGNEEYSKYKLKENEIIEVTGIGDENTKKYTLSIPISQWMAHKNKYKFIRGSWDYEYEYGGEEISSTASGSHTFPEEKIELSHKAIVAPSAKADGEYLYESIRIEPANGQPLPDGFTLKLSNREVLFPDYVSEDNKMELEGDGVVKKKPWTGYDLKVKSGDGEELLESVEYVYKEGDKNSPIQKVMEKDEEGNETGKFYYEVKWHTKVAKLPHNYKQYTTNRAKAKADVTYKYQGVDVNTQRSANILFFDSVNPNYDKIQIAQRNKDGKRITSWALVFNKDRKARAITEIEDTIKDGNFIEGSLKYYFVSEDSENIDWKQGLAEFLKSQTSIDFKKNKDAGKPYYTLTKDKKGNDKFTIKFGDNSSKLEDKINSIKKDHNAKSYPSALKRKEAINLEIIKYLFPDFDYMGQEVSKGINSNGEYFKDTSQEDTKRNFPNLGFLISESLAEGQGTISTKPFTSLSSDYINLKRTSVSTKTSRGQYSLVFDENVKGDILIVSYDTEASKNSESNKFKTTWLKEYPDVKIIEPKKGDPEGYPVMSVNDVGFSEESGTEEGTNKQTELYPINKHSFISNDMTDIKNGVLVNIFGSYCEEIEISDSARMSYGSLGSKYNSPSLYRFKLEDFNKKITELKEQGIDDDKAYNLFIEEFSKNKNIISNEEIGPNDYKISDDNKNISFKTGVNKENYEENRYVYLFLYSMEASYSFYKASKASINNTATVKYDKSLTVSDSSKIIQDDFLRKYDVTSENEAKTSGKKSYRISLDLSKYKLGLIKGVEINDSFGASNDKFVEIEKAELKGDLREDGSYDDAPADLKLIHEGKKFIVKTDQKKGLEGKKFNIVYDVKIDLSGVFAGQNGTKTIYNTATAVFKNSNNPPQTIKESVNASTTLEYGEFLKKSVEGPAKDATDEQIKQFKESSTRSYTLEFDLENKNFLKKANELIIKDSFDPKYHKFVKYNNPVMEGTGTEQLEISQTKNSNIEVEYKITKKSGISEFPEKFKLKYTVVLQNSEIDPEAKGKTITNTANAKFINDNQVYSQDAKAKTDVLGGLINVISRNLNLYLKKDLPVREEEKGQTKVPDYSGISFTLKGEYTPLDGSGNVQTDASGNPIEKEFKKNLSLSSDGSLKIEDIPVYGTYTLTENLSEGKKEEYTEVGQVKFTIDQAGKTITFDHDGPLEHKKVEVEAINDGVLRKYEETETKIIDGQEKVVPNKERTQEIYTVSDSNIHGSISELHLKVFNKLKEIKKHNLIFRKIDDQGKPLEGAKFKIYKISEVTGYEVPVTDEAVASDSEGIVKFTDLSNGKYIVREVETASGRYSKDLPFFEIELKDDMAKEYYYGDLTNQKLRLHNISFKKVDSKKNADGNDIPLKGAEFKLYKEGEINGRKTYQVLQTAKSDSSGKVEFINVAGGSYKIVETQAPIGYELGADRTVTFIGEGSIFEVKENKHEEYYKRFEPDREIPDLDDDGKEQTYYPAESEIPVPKTETIPQVLVKNSKALHSLEFTKYKEVYNKDDKEDYRPMEGASFILQERNSQGDFVDVKNGDETVKAISNKDGKVEFKGLLNKQYQIIEDPENFFADHEVNTNVIKVPDLTNSRDEARKIVLFDDKDKLNADEEFVNYKMRHDFSFKKLDEARDENGKLKPMANVEFKVYRKTGAGFEKEVYKSLEGSNKARRDFVDAIAVSDKDGNVVFKGFENGIYKIVETRVKGYAQKEFQVEISKDGVKFPSWMEEDGSTLLKNSYTRHDVSFKKIDRDTKQGLKAAEFKLEKLLENGSYQDLNKNALSSEDGLIEFRGLGNGKYRITEIKNPEGYIKEEKVINLSLTDSDLDKLVLDDVENQKKIYIPEQPAKSISISHLGEGLLNRKDHAAYMYGYPDGSFRPDRAMTRAEVTTMFGRLLLKKPARSNEFKQIYKDVNKDDWYASAITIMSDLNIVEGYPDGNFRPDAPITRAEFAALASRFEKLSGADVSFIDLSKSHWAYKSIASAYHKGWVKGYPDGSFGPEKNIKREEVAAITNRMLYRKCDLDFVASHKKELIMFFDNLESSWSYGDIIEATNGHDYIRKNDGFIDEIWQRLNGKEFHI